MSIEHVVMYSGGIGSYSAAARVLAEHGPDRVRLLFADTLVEDPDLYRFLRDSATELGTELVTVTDGRTPFQVFRDRRFIGNSRTAHCSTELKVRPCRAWLDEHAPTATVYVGIDWTEAHRLPAIVRGWAPNPVHAPLTEPPLLDRAGMLAELDRAGIDPPRAYREGFPHNNCLQQGCVRGGIAYWRHLLRVRPDAYAHAEAAELDLRDYLDTDATILTETTNGEPHRLSLTDLRERVQAQGALFDELDWGGCGCFTDADAPAGTPAP